MFPHTTAQLPVDGHTPGGEFPAHPAALDGVSRPNVPAVYAAHYLSPGRPTTAVLPEHAMLGGQPQQQQQQQQQWVMLPVHTPAVTGLSPQQQQRVSVVVCDGMTDLQAMSSSSMLPVAALYPQQAYSLQPVQLQPAVTTSMLNTAGQVQMAAPVMQPHMGGLQQQGRPGNQHQALWSEMPGLPPQGRGRGGMGAQHLAYNAVGQPVVRASSVEEILQLLRCMPRGSSVIDVVRDSLQYLDSRALAALLKELSKSGLRDMAFQIFNWLREPVQSMDPAYAGLLDVFTYTTMIAQCTGPVHLETALALMEEMRQRNVPANTHTYSSLLNVCVKAGQLNMALGVYNEMLSAGLQPNLVTYNTLLEVYAKRGMWREAVGVLDALEQQRLTPEPRTFNIVMNACNAAGQYAECIAVHERMGTQKVASTVGTYNAVLLAYCKMDQLAAAQQVFNEMRQQGCQPTHTTFIMLLQSAEAHGQATVAVGLLEQMQAMQLCLTPQCYAAAIGACATAGQLVTARKLLADMLASSKAGMAAPAHIIMQLQDKCCDWAGAFNTYQKLVASGVRPDRQCTATAIEALWGAGHVGSCLLAFKVFHAACKQGLFKAGVKAHALDPVMEFVVPGSGTCYSIVGMWTMLLEIRTKVLREGPTFLRSRVTLLLGDGQAHLPQLTAAATELCAAVGVPLQLDPNNSSTTSSHQVAMTATAEDLTAWLLSPRFAAVCPLVPSVEELDALQPGAVLAAEDAIISAVQQRFTALTSAEAGFVYNSQVLPLSYTQARPGLWAQVQAGCLALQPLSPGLPFAALALLDQAAHAGLFGQPQQASAAASPGSNSSSMPHAWLMAAAVMLAAQAAQPGQSQAAAAAAAGISGSPPADAAVAVQFNIQVDQLLAAVTQMRGACSGVCKLPVNPYSLLELYTEALMAGCLDYQVSIRSLVGEAQSLIAQAVVHPGSLDLPPSRVAALLIVAGRRAGGQYPAWPHCLAVMTGLLDPVGSAQQLLQGLIAHASSNAALTL